MDDTFPARAADHEPGRNHNFDRGWSFQVVVGPDAPENPAHGTAWSAEEEPLMISGSNFRNRLRQSAERAFQGSRESGYRRGGAA